MDIQTLFETHRLRNRIFALLAFFFAFAVYSLTVSPTTSFWDPSEYIAIAHTLQVAHPPGSPFFALWGRVFSMFAAPENVALSVNMISVLTSSLTIMLLYLIIVRLIQEWRGPADRMEPRERIALYGGGLIGAFTFTFTHTHWFNAVETEMYAPSMFLTALVTWLALRWSESHEEPRGERWLLLIAYIFGLGIGVHLLNLLALFFVALIIYFKKKEFTLASFAAMTGISMLAFLLIFPFTIINLPDLADNISTITYGLIGPVSYLVIILLLLGFGIWYTQTRRMRMANFCLLAYAMIIIGYSSYALVFIRSNANPPIDQNDPSSIESIVSYLKREQYGQTPLLMGPTYDNRTGNIDRNRESLFPRRHSPQPAHLDYYARFDSDWQFFWQYQVYHMYIRYFNWNFIGKESDIQDTGWYSGFGETRHKNNPANSGYFYLPFLLGLLGLLIHFRNDPKRAFSVLVLFVLTGLAIIFYLNQTPYEPRERDYAYVGSFFAFSIWIGIGAWTLIRVAGQRSGPALSWGTAALLFLAVPVWMGMQNWPSQSRSHNYVARDYAYNLLQSLERNAILFTNGDNDTFPLWYLQEVEGVRTDVRVVNLSLLNTDWYIRQMRDRTVHESLPLPISMSDEEIDQITSGLTLHDPTEIVLPVEKDLLKAAFGERRDALLEQASDPVIRNQILMATPYSLPVDSLDNEVRWYLEGRQAGRDGQGNMRYYLQTQDLMILEILRNNRWLRPVYFANTVSSQGLLGLHPWFQFEGKAYRVVPKRREAGPFGYLDPEVHSQRLAAFRFQDWDHPDVYFDENIRRMLTNYRYGFTQLADELIRRGDREEAARWLRYGEEKIPFRPIEYDWTIPALYAYRYVRAGADAEGVKLADFSKEHILYDLEWDLKELERIEERAARLEEEAIRARSRANISRQQRIRTEQRRVDEIRENLFDTISFGVSQLTILQYVYFQTGEQLKAENLALEVNLLTGGRIPMPLEREENERQIERFNLGI